MELNILVRVPHDTGLRLAEGVCSLAPETSILLWTRCIVVRFSLLWDLGAASTQVNLLGISAPYLLPVHCHNYVIAALASKLLSLVTLD